MSALTLRGLPESVRLSEHTAVIDHEYRHAGTVKHRQSREQRYAAVCLDCMWSIVNWSLPRVRREARAHRCQP